jgi:putative two-component system response regulator
MDEAIQPVILVVDDSPINLQIATRALRGSYRALAATSGESALDLLARHAEVDLILLDVRMPGMDGFEVCRQLKQNPRTAAIPVIFLTSVDNPDDVAQAFAVGGADLVNKPFLAPVLLARVATQLRVRALERELARLNGQKP